MQKTTVAKLELLSRHLSLIVNELTTIVGDESKLYAELYDEDENCPTAIELDILDDMRSDLFVVSETIKDAVGCFVREQKEKERGDE